MQQMLWVVSWTDVLGFFRQNFLSNMAESIWLEVMFFFNCIISNSSWCTYKCWEYNAYTSCENDMRCTIHIILYFYFFYFLFYFFLWIRVAGAEPDSEVLKTQLMKNPFFKGWFLWSWRVPIHSFFVPDPLKRPKKKKEKKRKENCCVTLEWNL